MRGGEIAASSGEGWSPLIAMSTICSATSAPERRPFGEYQDGMAWTAPTTVKTASLASMRRKLPSRTPCSTIATRRGLSLRRPCLDEATILLAQSAGLVDHAASSQLFADRGRVSREDGPQSLCPAIARAAGLKRTLRNAHS